tara:strand:- start:4754 stop:5215 length:462 start_codon:yes stop_codon:yes gene_type:complete
MKDSIFFDIEDDNFIYDEIPKSINYLNELNVKSDSEKLLAKYHDRFLTNNYSRQLIITLKTGEIIDISSCQKIENQIYEVNILRSGLQSDVVYSKYSISKIKNQTYSPKRIRTINVNDILYINTIDYKEDFKAIRNYTMITILFYSIINVFFN